MQLLERNGFSRDLDRQRRSRARSRMCRLAACASLINGRKRPTRSVPPWWPSTVPRLDSRLRAALADEMSENPGHPFQFSLGRMFVIVTLAAVVSAILAWIEPQREAPLASVLGSTILIIAVVLALIRAVGNLFGGGAART